MSRELPHLLQKKFAWAGKARATCTDFVAKSRPTLYYLQQLLANCNNLSVTRRAD